MNLPIEPESSLVDSASSAAAPAVASPQVVSKPTPIVRPPTRTVPVVPDKTARVKQWENDIKRCKAGLHAVLSIAPGPDARIAKIKELQDYLETLKPPRIGKAKSAKASMRVHKPGAL